MVLTILLEQSAAWLLEFELNCCKKEEKTAQAAQKQEQRRKKVAAKQVEMDKLVHGSWSEHGVALQELKLEAVTDITSVDQLRRLTGAQLNALHWCQVHKTAKPPNWRQWLHC